jgi:Glycosyltransferase like family
MIAFGCSVTAPKIYERCAKPGIELAAEPDSQVFAHAAAGPISRAYNLVLERAGTLDDLEAVVLLHQDAEIVDPDFCSKLRRALSDPEVAVVGCVGGTGARGIGWWQGSITWGAAFYRYGELGGGDVSITSLNGQARKPRTGEVETLYGVMLALAPWAVRNLRFDESLGPLHGYDVDLCLQARAAGRKVVTEDLAIAHHHSLDLLTEAEVWAEAYLLAAEKWDGRAPSGGDEIDWKQRARRAEAEAGAAQLESASRMYEISAASQAQEAQLREITESTSWRITEPLRRLNVLRRTFLRR